MSSSKSKVCLDLEWAPEERLKRKAATISHDAKASKRNKVDNNNNTLSSNTTKKRGRPKKDGTTKKKKDGNGITTKKSKGSPTNKKQSIKRVRQQRKAQQSKDAEKARKEEAKKKARKPSQLNDHAGNIIVAAEKNAAALEDFFWEVEAVIGRRVHRGRIEYLIRWKGCSEEDNTWEPTANLCDTAMEEAKKYTKELKRKEKQREEDEKKLFGEPEVEITTTKDDKKELGDLLMVDTSDIVVIDEPTNTAVNNVDSTAHGSMEVVEPDVPIVDDNYWKWSDKDQVIYKDIERVNVHDPDAAKIVTEARINGTPLVLVGHVGWANFATRWLTEKKVEKEEKKETTVPQASTSENNVESNVPTNEGGESEGLPVKPVAIDLTSKGDSNDEEVAKPATIDLTKESAVGIPEIATEEKLVSVMAIDETTNKSIVEERTSKPTEVEETKVKETEKPCDNSKSDNLLDLSKNYELDVKKMIKDIGGEDVPVIKRNYNEEKPIHGIIPAEKFLSSCWPTSLDDASHNNGPDETITKTQKNTASNLYLHQWQFPLSDTAGRKLCHHNNPLPKGIMGEDLLKYWLDLPQCKLDSPLQYIFMGREDTLSKLHKDPGGLEISIAPIVGQKECVLVHRDDGSNCLYNLTASLEDIDLQRYPLLSQARTWRSVIQPGEILLMPYGTYHQCRNVTPCLSYSRFHLDTVNLIPFVQSLVNGDAPEIDQEEVLWNLTTEFIDRVDQILDKVQTRVKAGLDEGDIITGDIVDTVNTLRTLRHFMREVARREEIRKIVKGPDEDSDTTNNPDNHNFGMLVDDVDMCLHEFRYRNSKVIPPFKARRGKVLKNIISGKSSGGRFIGRDMSKFQINGRPVVAFNTSLENNYTSLVNADVSKHYPNHVKDKVGESLIKELKPGDLISVKLEQKMVKTEVIEILPKVKAAYLSFEDYPSVYDEYQPCDLLRLPTRAEIPTEDLKPGLVVLDFSNSNEYRAKIQSTMNGPMLKVKLIVSQHDMIRLVSPAMILGRYVPRNNRKANKKSTVDEVPEPQLAPDLDPSQGRGSHKKDEAKDGTSKNSTSDDESQLSTQQPQKPDNIYLPQGKERHSEPAPAIGLGWTQLVIKRSENNPGQFDRYYISPEGKRLRSWVEVERYLKPAAKNDLVTDLSTDLSE